VKPTSSSIEIGSEHHTEALVSAFRTLAEQWGPVDYGRQLNAADAFAAYRLLLGRNPSADELRTLVDSPQTLRQFLECLATTWEFERSAGFFPPNRVLMSEVEGFRFWFNTSDREMGVRMALGLYEPESVAVMKRIVKPGMRCIDAGAQTGFFTCLMASLVGEAGAVDAFEPMPASFSMLSRNVHENGWPDRVRLHRLAVSRAPSAIEVSTLGRMFVVGSIESAVRTEIQAVRLDDVIHTRVDFIKLDIEGHEPAALEGMRQLIETSKPIIMSECNEYWLRHCSQTTSQEYCRRLESLGYDLYVPEDLSRPKLSDTFNLGTLDTIDIVAVPKGAGPSRGWNQ
jgi:FkbM family methyltransferase